MPNFEALFRESKGQPVDYNDQTIRMCDYLEVSDGQVLYITFESTSSIWRQGVYLLVDGRFEVNNRFVPKSVVLWQDTAPQRLSVRVHPNSTTCDLMVKNVWDTGDGVMNSWHNGAAMIVDDIDFGRRYRCNDGQPDDDFDDLIFQISWNA